MGKGKLPVKTNIIKTASSTTKIRVAPTPPAAKEDIMGQSVKISATSSIVKNVPT